MSWTYKSLPEMVILIDLDISETLMDKLKNAYYLL